MKFIYYRPEVNGLRGIAVMAAVFYHAEIVFQSFRIFPGGFLGVDVFFVISGYLMTAIILKEYEANKSFSFKNYYKRRIRRLLPALLAACMLPPRSAKRLRKIAKSSTRMLR